MTAKEYLRQIYCIDRKVKRIQERRDDLRAEMYAISSPSGKLGTDKVQTSLSGDSMLRLIAKVEDTESDLVAEMDRLLDLKEKISRQIEALDDERYKTLLLKRYVMLKSWEQIAVEMGYRIKWVYDLHGRALRAFAEKWGI